LDSARLHLVRALGINALSRCESSGPSHLSSSRTTRRYSGICVPGLASTAFAAWRIALRSDALTPPMDASDKDSGLRFVSIATITTAAA
jgi:hypothetical protein